jgi:DNA-binding transcriptional LysR family regulator
MLNNYKYFLVLSEELNISNAAKRLFISHQCLSKYLKGLEEKYGVSFFERKPKFGLTPAGKILLNTLRQIELSEQNFENQITDIKEAKSGIIHFGITEGRYSILVPKLLKEFHSLHPKVELTIHRATSLQMQEMVQNNSLDLFLSGVSNLVAHDLKYDIVINEHMYIVISDNLLKQYFSDSYPECIETFSKGVDLRLFQKIPFVLNKKNFNSRILLDKHLAEMGISLNCINELTQPDIHYLLCAEDYAACFCLSMYLSGINQLNQLKAPYSHLNVFPIANFSSVNPLALIYHRNKIFPSYTQDLKKIVKRFCSPYSTLIK